MLRQMLEEMSERLDHDHKLVPVIVADTKDKEHMYVSLLIEDEEGIDPLDLTRHTPYVIDQFVIELNKLDSRLEFYQFPITADPRSGIVQRIENHLGLSIRYTHHRVMGTGVRHVFDLIAKTVKEFNHK